MMASKVRGRSVLVWGFAFCLAALVAGCHACDDSDFGYVGDDAGLDDDVEVGDTTDHDVDLDVDGGGDADIGPEPDADADPEPTCDDGIKNGEETDIDCGGPDCEPCEIGQVCEINDDCESEICEDEICVSASCAGVDCDGGQSCYQGDCFDECEGYQDCPPEDRCYMGVCLPRDCGGVTCDAGDVCYLGGCYEACDSDGQCADADADCLDGACVVPTCDDGLLNGDETDIDCGGPDCPLCEPGESCDSGDDCTTGVCDNNACQPASCDDGVLNGDETDIDCGGPDCNPCDVGQSCDSGSDCATGYCDGGQCVECIDDEHCGDNQICEENSCDCNDPRDTQEICEQDLVECGQTNNVCGQAVDCGGCPGANMECQAQSCVCVESRSEAEICEDEEAECGDVVDVCDEPVSCGICGDGVCHDNLCVDCAQDSDCGDSYCDDWSDCEEDETWSCTGERTRICYYPTCAADNICMTLQVEETEDCHMPDGSTCACADDEFGNCQTGACECPDSGGDQCTSDADCLEDEACCTGDAIDNFCYHEDHDTCLTIDDPEP